MTWESTAPILGNSIKEFKRAVEALGGYRIEVRMIIHQNTKHRLGFWILLKADNTTSTTQHLTTTRAKC